MEIFLGHFQIYLVMFARVVGIVMIVPPLASLVIPVRVKMLFSLFFTMLVYSSVAEKHDYFSLLNLPTMMYILVIVKELMVGVIVGFLVSIFMALFQLASEIFSMQMGLGFASTVDPNFERDESLVGFMFYMFISLVFFQMGGLHMILSTLYDSFFQLSITDMAWNTKGFVEIGSHYFQYMFVMALKLSLPVIMLTVLVVIVMGLLGKIAPQANLLMMSLPTQWTIGLLSLLIVLPYGLDMFAGLFSGILSESLKHVVGILRGSDV